MTAADRLNEIEARANAATKGPWESDEYTEIDPDGFYELSRVIAPDPDDGEDYAIGVVHVGILRPDATFIAHARTDVPALVAALRAVLEVHAPDPYCGNWHHNPHRCPCAIPACADGCDTYPCPTVRAIEEALNA